jgi:signal transduction histidine kinase
VSQETAIAPTLAALRQARETQDRIWRWMRLLGPLLTAAVALVTMRTFPMPGLSGQGLLVTVSLVAFVIGALGALYQERETRAHTASTALLVAGAVALVRTQSDRTGFIALFVALFVLARRLPARLAITLSAVATACLVLAGATAQRVSGFSSVLTAFAIAGFAGLTMLTQQLREANEQAERQLDEFERTRAAEARAAALAERQHLAREMHDVLAHSLAGLMLQLEGARLLVRAYDGDPRLPEAIERAHRLGKSGLDEARRAIEMLRGDDLPGPDRLAALAQRCEEDLGIPCRLTVLGEPVELGSQARLALYRAAQEALTNIAKHAYGAERVELALTYEENGAVLTVEDLGAATTGIEATATTGETTTTAVTAMTGVAEVRAMAVATAATAATAKTEETVVTATTATADATDVLVGAEASSAGIRSAVGGGGGGGLPADDAVQGYGLTGMRERAELLGGTLEATHTPTGFLVRVTVPA